MFFFASTQLECFTNVFLTPPLKAVAQRYFAQKSVLKNFAKFTGKHLCQSLFFNETTGVGITSGSLLLHVLISSFPLFNVFIFLFSHWKKLVEIKSRFAFAFIAFFLSFFIFSIITVCFKSVKAKVEKWVIKIIFK